MATQFKGKVFKLYPSRYGGDSFRLEDNPDYFNPARGDKFPDFVQPGQVISFSAGDLRGKGREVIKGSVAQVAQESSGGGQSGGQQQQFGSSSQRDDSIRYQSSRKDALSVVALLIQTGALKLPEAVAKKLGVIESAVDRYTAMYFEDIDTLGALQRVERESFDAEPPKAGKKDDGESLPE